MLWAEVGRGMPFPLPSEIPRAVVALEAQSEHHRTQEQPRIGRSMRSVAGLAPVHTNSEMFENEGSAFVGMAFKTRLLVRHSLVYVARARGHSPR